MSDSLKAVKKTICLNMIVKNESHIIVDTLKHLLSYMTFDYWVISDTGSTDNTRELIKDFFKEHGIPGELDETPWKDFGYNRTVAFERAYNKTDYVFVWDADDEIRGSFRTPEPLIADSYMFTFGNESGFRYSRCQLFNNRKKWKYVGVLHEYPACTETVGPPVNVRGDYYFVSGRKGARNKDPNKYLNDALVLEKGYEKSVEEKNPNGRYVFYCAQSYNSANIFDKAIEWYKKTLTTNTWIQEKYVSCFEIYSMYEQQGKAELGLSYLVESYKYCNTRIECIYRLVKYYCVNNMVDIAYMYYTLVQKYYENEYLKDEVSKHLFTKKEEYDFYFPYYMIIVAERCKKMDTMIQMYRMISKIRYLHAGQWWYTNLFTNLQFAVEAFPQDLELLSNLLSYVDALREKGLQFTTDHYKTIENIITKLRPCLTALSVVPTLTRRTPQIMFTVTTCKRFDLFEQTMNSILRNWTDLQSVDYFFCVDDNSSQEERTLMQTSYPFFDYYMKTPEEKGHRESMNIIWKKLQEVKPKYWIHLEDDWVYIRPENYVQRAKAALDKYEEHNIHQVVFNRNYGILYPQMELVGGATLEPGLVKHEMKEIKVGRNCAYWPHYSLQPSMTRVSKILELGNYDSTNTFFERDYANKYNAAGYKTAFFNSIYSIHIGKQHWEKEGKNAYALNETGQFSKNQNIQRNPEKKNQRLTGTMQQHLETILEKIQEGTPFGLIRPSDGEHRVLKGETLTNCDKWTFTSGGKLQKELLEAVQTVDTNLYIGIPCNTCSLKWNCTQTIYNDYINTFGVPLAQRTYANLFMNSNWALFTNFIKSYDKGIYMITSGKNESELKILDRFLISPTLVNVWDTEGTAETERLLNFIKDKKGLFCFSAGPLSKVWIPLCMKANPSNTYLDTGSALDCFTKGSINRIYYTNPSSEYSKMSCRFIEQKEQTQPNKNLVYCCVFYNKDYIELLKLLFASINVFSTKKMDFLVFTNPEFQPLVENFTKKLPFHVKIHCFDFKTLFQAACARLFIFDYPEIEQYEKILYLDTDILVKGDLANVFRENLEEKLYALEEGTIGMPNFGSQFFTEKDSKDSKDSKNPNTSGMNSGVLLFKKCHIIKGLFQEIRDHVTTYTEQGLPVPACADQPFINYHAITKNLCDNKMLITYVHNLNSSERVVTSPTTYETQSICHFSWPIGNFYNKFSRMKTYLSDILKNYKSIVDNPINLMNTLDVDNSKIVNKTYTWGKGNIRFEDNCKLYTIWVGGTYEIIDTYLVKASWSIYSHYLHFNEDYTEFISVREGDADIFHCFL